MGIRRPKEIVRKRKRAIHTYYILKYFSFAHSPQPTAHSSQNILDIKKRQPDTRSPFPGL